MKLWILSPKECLPTNDNPWLPWYDKAFGFVVRADSENRAREICGENAGNEVSPISNPWLSEKYTTCTELTAIGNEKLIMKDFASA